jgi:predicted dehydrogenase
VTPERRTRIVVIGAGRRARQTLLPAIHSSSEWVDLVAVCTRTAREIELLGGRLRAVTRPLKDIDLAEVDAAVIAVPLPQVPEVLAELDEHPARKPTLMLDTPGLAPGDLGAARRFPRFPAVLASEDNFALPLFVQARLLLDEGRIGRLLRVYMLHSGYRHHAIAALKQLTGSRHPRRVSVHRWNRWCSDVRMTFPGGIHASIVEPRRYEIGRTMIVGSNGFITDYPIDHPKATCIEYRVVDGRYLGLTVDGEPVGATALDDAFASRLDGAPLEDPSVMSQMKIRGFMELLAALPETTSRFRYPIQDAIADDLAIRFAERLPFAVPGGPRFLRSAARLTAPFIRPGGDEG